MDLGQLETMPPAELRRYVEFLLWHYRVVDGFWFLYVADEYSQAEAERLNERVWARVSGLAARDLVSRFHIEEKGLQGFLKVLRVYPWTLLLEYDINRNPLGIGPNGAPTSLAANALTLRAQLVF